MTALTSLGPVHLRVSDLDRSIAYYEEMVGLRELARESRLASPGAGERELLVIHEQRDATPLPAIPASNTWRCWSRNAPTSHPG